MKFPFPKQWIGSHSPLRIAVAGAGGNGSQVMNGLARMHVALRALGHPGLNVHLFDPDIVTDANVGRQLFSPSDIGAPKARVVIHRLNCYFGLNWRASHARLDRTSAGQRFDLLIGCVDSAAARRELAKVNADFWLDLGNTDKKGQVILGQKYVVHDKKDYAGPKLPTVLHIFPELRNRKRREDNTPSCSLAQALERQDLFINQSVATFALQLLWQFIRQGGLNIHGYFINLETGRVSPLPIK